MAGRSDLGRYWNTRLVMLALFIAGLILDAQTRKGTVRHENTRLI